MSIQRGLVFDSPFEGVAQSAVGRVDSRLMQWAPQAWPVADDWLPVVRPFLASAEAGRLGQFVQQRLAAGAVIYPPQPLHALTLTSLAAVRVVILGQDPYHGSGQAQGLAFSVVPGARVPPSLRNIFKEISRDDAALKAPPSARLDGSLGRWAEQGVLLLNTCLTVEDGLPASHAKRGWEGLTDALIQAVAQKAEPVVFMLWGAHAQAKVRLLDEVAASTQGIRHLRLMANHPSPLSALRPPQPFIGCGHFSRANEFLVRHGFAPVVW
jgi:uracil-DNA glycosylase